MNLQRFLPRRLTGPCWRRLYPLLALVAVTGCDRRDDIKVYRVEKPAPAAAPAAHSPHGLPDGHPEIQRARPQLTWTLPAGWTETPGSRMSLANFTITGEGGQEAQVSVTPLGGLAGKEVAIVNMWRQQVGQPELSPDEVIQQLQSVDIGGDAGKLFEVTGKADATARPMRIITAMAHRSDTSWFYKLQGDAELVEAQKPAFVAFLKTIKITEAPAGVTPAATPPPTYASETATDSKWNPPADWRTVPPGAMQVAKFLMPDQNAAKADVTISVFPNSTGGNLDNINRWRRQIQLPPVAENELAKLVTPLDAQNPDAVLVDMTNSENKRQLIGAIVPRGGQWFFFKLMGDLEAVTPQKDVFVKFVQTADY